MQKKIKIYGFLILFFIVFSFLFYSCSKTEEQASQMIGVEFFPGDLSGTGSGSNIDQLVYKGLLKSKIDYHFNIATITLSREKRNADYLQPYVSDKQKIIVITNWDIDSKMIGLINNHEKTIFINICDSSVDLPFSVPSNLYILVPKYDDPGYILGKIISFIRNNDNQEDSFFFTLKKSGIRIYIKSEDELKKPFFQGLLYSFIEEKLLDNTGVSFIPAPFENEDMEEMYFSRLDQENEKGKVGFQIFSDNTYAKQYEDYLSKIDKNIYFHAYSRMMNDKKNYPLKIADITILFDEMISKFLDGLFLDQLSQSGIIYYGIKEGCIEISFTPLLHQSTNNMIQNYYSDLLNYLKKGSKFYSVQPDDYSTILPVPEDE